MGVIAKQIAKVFVKFHQLRITLTTNKPRNSNKTRSCNLFLSDIRGKTRIVMKFVHLLCRHFLLKHLCSIKNDFVYFELKRYLRLDVNK